MIPKVRLRPSVTVVPDSVSVMLVSAVISVTGVIGAPQGNCPTVYLVGTASITGTGLLETSEVKHSSVSSLKLLARLSRRLIIYQWSIVPSVIVRRPSSSTLSN